MCTAVCVGGAVLKGVKPTDHAADGERGAHAMAAPAAAVAMKD